MATTRRTRHPRPVADRQRDRWQADYDAACAGHSPPGTYDPDDWRETLEAIGRDLGYLTPPAEGDVMNATIRAQAGRASDDDRAVLAADKLAREARGS